MFLPNHGWVQKGGDYDSLQWCDCMHIIKYSWFSFARWINFCYSSCICWQHFLCN